jgi:hypothetical protein
MPPTGKHFKYLYNSTLGALIPAVSLSQFVRSAKVSINHGIGRMRSKDFITKCLIFVQLFLTNTLSIMYNPDAL